MVAHRRTRKRFTMSYPKSGVICGRPECRKSALVWLTLDEERAYKRGERIFSIPSHRVKLQVQ
jgi:hypothetical protein